MICSWIFVCGFNFGNFYIFVPLHFSFIKYILAYSGEVCKQFRKYSSRVNFTQNVFFLVQNIQTTYLFIKIWSEFLSGTIQLNMIYFYVSLHLVFYLANFRSFLMRYPEIWRQPQAITFNMPHYQLSTLQKSDKFDRWGMNVTCEIAWVE